MKIKLTKKDLERAKLHEAVDWNKADPFHLEIWDKLVGNFWLPETVPLSNDLKTWQLLSQEERDIISRVFAGLTALDTIQGTVGAVSLIPDSEIGEDGRPNPYEEAIYTNIAFMESVHAKSYSQIFSTFLDSRSISELFAWAKEDVYLQTKAAIILHYYNSDDPEKKKIASVFLESFLFYSGFYVSMKYAAMGKLTNTADLIRLIIRDEAVHGFFIGYKFRRAFENSSPERQEELVNFANDLFNDLYENEKEYSASLYDSLGLTHEANAFLKYNANKAFDNLGLPQPFDTRSFEVPAEILSALSPNGDETHDFFSSKGSSYVVGRDEHLDSDEWGTMF